MHADRISALADELWLHVFTLLDDEPDCTGARAGFVAAQAERAFRQALEQTDGMTDGQIEALAEENRKCNPP